LAAKESSGRHFWISDTERHTNFPILVPELHSGTRVSSKLHFDTWVGAGRGQGCKAIGELSLP